MSERPEQPNPADLIDALADYFVARGASESKDEMVNVLTALSLEKLKYFADLSAADLMSRTPIPRRERSWRSIAKPGHSQIDRVR